MSVGRASFSRITSLEAQLAMQAEREAAKDRRIAALEEVVRNGISEWRPIASAPKDQRILLLWPLNPEFAVQTGMWVEDVSSKRPRPHWSSLAVAFMKVDWFRKHPPTHWMPLPAARAALTPEAGRD